MRSLVILISCCFLLGGQVVFQTGQAQSVPDPSVAAPPVKPEDKCTIEGTVLNSASGEIIKKAGVMLRSMGNMNGAGRTAVSDGAGHFKIEDVDPGRYTLLANRTGFLPEQYGSKGFARPGTVLTLTSGQNLKDVVFKLIPQGVVSGKIVDEDGDPLPHVMVQSQRYVYSMNGNGKRQLNPAGSANTNDLGEYRIFGLAPGKYYIVAHSQNAEMQGLLGGGDPHKNFEEGYAPVFYPNSLTADGAAPLVVAPGATMRGIDLTLSKTRAVRLRGHVTTSSKNTHANVSLISRDGAQQRAFGRPSDDKGNFEIHGVVPGSYFLLAQTFEEGKQSMAKVPIEVGSANIDGLQIVVTPPVDISGRIVVENNADTNAAAFNLVLQSKFAGPFGGGMNNTQTDKDGSFTVRNVNADAYVVNLYGLTENFYLKAVRLGSADVTDTGLDFTQGVAAADFTILVSPAGGQVDGVVQNAASQPVAGAQVTLIPEGEKRSIARLYKLITTGQGGNFTIKGIAPGEYKLFAWEDSNGGAYRDPDFLKPFESKGESVSIKENARETKPLKLIPSDDPDKPPTQ